MGDCPAFWESGPPARIPVGGERYRLPASGHLPRCHFSIDGEASTSSWRGAYGPMALDDAIGRSRLEPDGIEQIKQLPTDIGHRAQLASVYRDLRIGARVFSRQRGFFLIAAVTVAIGIGSVPGVYSFSRFLFNQNVTGANRPEDLATIFLLYRGSRTNRNSSGYAQYLELKHFYRSH